jgi:hypothetical protein
VRHKRRPGTGDPGPKVDRETQSKSRSSESPPSKQVFAAVYDGQACIGFMLRHGCHGVEAFDAGENSLGVYRNQEAAAFAIYAAFDREGGL